jgi:hypothetical protein
MGIFWETKAISYENSVFSLKSIPFEIILKKTIFTKSGKKVTAVKIKKKISQFWERCQFFTFPYFNPFYSDK